MKYRKKPVTVEAFKWNGKPQTADDLPDWMLDAMVSGKLVFSLCEQSKLPCILIETIEGVMKAYPGYWIIQGVKKELYPCRSDVFLSTYEPVSE